MTEYGSRAFILGLDGADWKILDHMIERGVMPNLKRLKEKSSWGYLNSTIPPITCPAWLVFGTGMNPGKLGVYYFLVREGHGYHTVPFYFRRDVAGNNFWDQLSEKGFNIGIVNIPTVHQPYKINGFMISGFMSRSRRRWVGTREGEPLTFPEGLESEIIEKVGEYNIDFPKTTSKNYQLLSFEEEIEEYEQVALQRTRTIEYLMRSKKWDIFLVDIMATDRISHSVYQLICPDGEKYTTSRARELRRMIEGFYHSMDDIVGRIRKAAGEDCHFFVMSDHGFGNMTGRFAINDWLMEKGYMRLKDQKRTTSPSPKRKNLFKKIYNAISRFNHRHNISPIIESVVKSLPGRMQRSIPDPLKLLTEDDVDWGNTKVFYREFGHLFINLKGREPEGIVDPDGASKLMKELVRDLDRDVAKHFNGPGRFRYFFGKDIYSGKYKEFAPDIYFDFDGILYNIDTRVGHEENFEPMPDWMKGNHRQDGIFIFDHPDAKAGKVEGLNLIDLAPTILHIFDQEIPENIDGRCLKSIFRDDSPTGSRKIRIGKPTEKLLISIAISKLKI